jgi:glycerol-3-phosphate O-acyltransferase/dihydroxyacetone phosphate acyltransferase
MALGALARGTSITIVPVGMSYFSAHKFRSRAVIEFGNSVPVPASLIQDFKNGKKQDAVRDLMSQIHEALDAVTVSAPDFNTLMACCVLVPFQLIMDDNISSVNTCHTKALPHQYIQ